MARPKSTTPNKGKLNLTISDQTRAELQFISQQTGLSISQLVAEWARKEARRTAKATGTPLPDAQQLTMEGI